MRILLVTMGGKMDCCLNHKMQPNQPYVRSHAINALTHLCRVRTRMIAPAFADFLPIGRKGATGTTKASCDMLGKVIGEQQTEYDRILVTVNARETFWLSRRLAFDWLFPTCPIIVTGAEAPNPADHASNREANLTVAAFSNPSLKPNVYMVEGNIFKTAIPQRGRYEARHPRRASTMRAFA